jgi:hypothetical protein
MRHKSEAQGTASESMTGGERSHLEDVLKAIHALADREGIDENSADLK